MAEMAEQSAKDLSKSKAKAKFLVKSGLHRKPAKKGGAWATTDRIR